MQTTVWEVCGENGIDRVGFITENAADNQTIVFPVGVVQLIKLELSDNQMNELEEYGYVQL